MDEWVEINLNDPVRFRIKPHAMHLFIENPGIDIDWRERDALGCHLAEAQLRVLIDALSGLLVSWRRNPPIQMTVSVHLGISGGVARG